MRSLYLKHLRNPIWNGVLKEYCENKNLIQQNKGCGRVLHRTFYVDG